MRVGLNDYPDETISDADIVERLNEIREQFHGPGKYRALGQAMQEIFKVLALREKQNVGSVWP
jgi:hypothetical protein